MRRHPHTLLIAVIVALALPGSAAAATLTVTNNADSGAGSLRAAIAASSSGDTIDFAPALNGQTITLTSGELLITHALTVAGPGASQLTISGNHASAVFDMNTFAGDITISGLTITAGKYTGSLGGGGIASLTAHSLTLSGDTITGNQAAVSSPGSAAGGGGVFADGFPLTVTNSTITNNTITISGAGTNAAIGGGGIFSDGGTSVVTGSNVSGNSVSQTASSTGGTAPAGDGGGGIYSNGGDITVTNSTVDNNSDNIDSGRQADGGGGIFSNGGITTLTGTTVNGNAVTVGSTSNGGDGGGGVYSDGGTTTVTSSAIDGNTATVTDAGGADGGMGLASIGGTLTIHNSTIANNSGTITTNAAVNGGGAVLDLGGSTSFLNSTLSGNSMTINGTGAGDGGGAIVTGTFDNVSISDSTIADNTANKPGGAIYAGNSSSFTFKNTIVADNTASPAGNCAGTATFTSDGFNIDSGSSCGFSQAGDHQNTEPLEQALANNGGPAPTQALPANSPAVDTGTCTDTTGATVTTDERGVARPQGKTCDIGAFEYVPPTSPPPPPPPSPPTNTVPPKVTGNPLPGNPLNCSTGTWTGNPTSYAYRWNRTGTPITAATTNRYTVQVKDEAQTLTCTVTATNPGGSTSATSPPVLVAQPGTLHCPKPFGKLAGTQLGPFKLGMTRTHARKLQKHWHLAPYGLDDYCFYAGWGIRVGYPSKTLLRTLNAKEAKAIAGRIILFLSANPYWKLGGIGAGDTITTATRRLHLGKPFHIGANYWYEGPGKQANIIIKSRHGVIYEIGLANKALTEGRKAQARFLSSFGG